MTVALDPHPPAPAPTAAEVGLPNFFAPVGTVISQAVAELCHELHRAGFPLDTRPGYRRPVTVDITVDRDSEGALLWRATLRIEAVGWAEDVDNDPATPQAWWLTPNKQASLFDTRHAR